MTTRATFTGPTRYDGTELVLPDGVVALVLLNREPNGDLHADYGELRGAPIDRDQVALALTKLIEVIR